MVKAFTLLESLVTFFITSMLILLFSGSIQSSFQAFEKRLFFIQFETFYLESQKLAAARQEKLTLKMSQEGIESDGNHLKIPAGLQLEKDMNLVLDSKGGNSDLKKVTFSYDGKKVEYQLNIGNGKIKKKES